MWLFHLLVITIHVLLIPRKSECAGTGSQEGPVGKRPCHLAFVIQLSQLLRQVQDGFSGDHQQLADALKVSRVLFPNWGTKLGAPTSMLVCCAVCTLNCGCFCHAFTVQ